MAERRNGMRQPQSSNFGPNIERQARMTRSERNRPTVAVVWIQLVKKPRLFGGACSAT